MASSRWCFPLLLLLLLLRTLQGIEGMERLALSIALDHPVLSSNQGILCAAARTCRCWRTAVQQCSGCNIDVAVSSSTSLLTLASLVTWLSSHGGLVRSITANINVIDSATINDVSVPPYRAAAQLMLQQALQLLAAKEDVEAADNACLRLADFSSNFLATPAVLCALPAHILSRLDLCLDQSGPVNGPAMASALAELSKLQQLVLTSRIEDSTAPADCLAGIRHLPQLTSLRLQGTWTHDLKKQLAQPLPLQQLSLQLFEQWNLLDLDLSRLSCLQGLEATRGLADSAVLPAQLQRLTMVAYDNYNLSAVTGLQQLQQLRLTVEFEDPQLLLPLAQLPALQMLELVYDWPPEFVGTAPAWRALSQLRALRLLNNFEYGELPTPQEFAAALAAAAACSSVTSLTLDVAYEQLEEDGAGEKVRHVVPVGKHLSGMTGLCDLRMHTLLGVLVVDVTALSSLTGLTRLDVELGAGILQDFDVALLAGSLKQLRQLILCNNDLRSMVCLASIAHLSHLTSLDVEGNPGVTAQGLMALTRLKGLQQLTVSNSAAVTDAE
jgi:Leucine-rich repeat (LRR) protein